MFNFLKSTFTRASDNTEAETLVEEFAKQELRHYSYRLENFTAGIKYQNAEPQLQRDVVLAMLSWFEKNPIRPLDPNGNRQDWNLQWQKHWKMRELFLAMLKRRLPLSEQDLIAILDWSVSRSENHSYYRGIPQMIKVVGDYLNGNEIDDKLQKAIDKLIHILESENTSVEVRRWVLRLKELKGDTDISLPLATGDVWADQAIAETKSLDITKQTLWAELLLHCLRTTGSAPSSKWLKGADKYLSVIGISNFFNQVLHWFPLVDKSRPAPSNRYDNVQTLLPVNADILKGLAWLCSKSDNPEIARALTALAISAYKKIPGSGPRAGKVGNACFWALGNMPGSEGVAQLSILKIKVKTNNAQKLIASALETAARRLGMTAEEIEEMSVPTYGLEEVGLRRDYFGEVVSEVKVDGSDVEQIWVRKDAKRIASAPKAVKEKYPEELKEISQAVKDIRKMLPA